MWISLVFLMRIQMKAFFNVKFNNEYTKRHVFTLHRSLFGDNVYCRYRRIFQPFWAYSQIRNTYLYFLYFPNKNKILKRLYRRYRRRSNSNSTSASTRQNTPPIVTPNFHPFIIPTDLIAPAPIENISGTILLYVSHWPLMFFS